MTRHLLVIGAQRCGTTYLHDLLAAHPQIAMARPARPEPKVLLDEALVARGRQWYVDTWFAHAGEATVLGDKSTSYLEHPEAADRARALLGDPLALVQLRDPLTRAVSNWAFSSDHGLETRPLPEALEACLAGDVSGPAGPAATAAGSPGAGPSVSPFDYLARGRYADHLAPWVAALGDDLAIGFLEDLLADPDAIAATYRFLGVDPGFRPASAGVPVNASTAAAPDLDPGLVRRLRAYWADSDAALGELAGRPVPWPGTDDRPGPPRGTGPRTASEGAL